MYTPRPPIECGTFLFDIRPKLVLRDVLDFFELELECVGWHRDEEVFEEKLVKTRKWELAALALLASGTTMCEDFKNPRSLAVLSTKATLSTTILVLSTTMAALSMNNGDSLCFLDCCSDGFVSDVDLVGFVSDVDFAGKWQQKDSDAGLGGN
ncbi:hypothetical protein L1887_35549 [Cichorium endivia]|nr:hypothetical protein L1887_35549 [Cichorium endivia]